MQEQQIKLANTWFYDEALQYCRERVVKNFKAQKQAAADLKKVRKKAKRLDRQPILDFRRLSERELIDQETLRLRTYKALCKSLLREAQETQARLDNTRPVRVGPATLDSLLNFEPDNYDYILKGQLPFPSLFFDAPYGQKLKIEEEEKMLYGIYFSIESSKDFKSPYKMILYMKEGDEITDVHIILDPIKKDRCYLERGSGILFQIDMQERKMTVIEKPGFYDHVTDRKVLDNLRSKCTGDIIAVLSKDKDAPFVDGFIQAANLCVNLINYINAENITIRERKGGPRRPRRGNKGPRNKEYVVVDITSKELIRYSRPQHHWELTERIYVRGHNRRYRDENGNIYKVIWIRPHIKGPPNAPFKNQRHQYFAKQIELERRLEEGDLATDIEKKVLT